MASADKSKKIVMSSIVRHGLRLSVKTTRETMKTSGVTRPRLDVSRQHNKKAENELRRRTHDLTFKYTFFTILTILKF